MDTGGEGFRAVPWTADAVQHSMWARCFFLLFYSSHFFSLVPGASADPKCIRLVKTNDIRREGGSAAIASDRLPLRAKESSTQRHRSHMDRSSAPAQSP